MKRLNRIFTIIVSGKLRLAKRIRINIIAEFKKQQDLVRRKEILELVKSIKEDQLKLDKIQLKLTSLNT